MIDFSKNIVFVFIYLIKIDTKRFRVVLENHRLAVYAEVYPGELAMKSDRSCVSAISCLAKPYPTHSPLLFYLIRPNCSRTSAADKWIGLGIG